MRRAIRNFKGSLTESHIRDLLNETRHCASACNYRPLKFLVLNRNKMDEIAIPAVTVMDSHVPGLLAK